MKREIRASHVGGVLNAPTSKSYAQRAVAAALLAEGETLLQNMELCNDTEAALDVARRLGATVVCEGRDYRITGGLNPLSSDLNIGESGLATRLFTPIAALCGQPLTITGHGSILTRPVSMMEQPLRDLGAQVSTREGFLPIHVYGPLQGGEVVVDGSMSSQFITGLLMALPLAGRDSVVRVAELNSKPYVDMTIEVAGSFGVEITHDRYSTFHIQGNQRYLPQIYNVEGDWSGVSCILVAGAVAGNIMVKNLNSCSLQADMGIIVALDRAGANILAGGNTYTVSKSSLRGFEFDATHCPDLFPALVALAANCEGRTVLTGTKRLTNKESDRAKTLADVFGRLGIRVDISTKDVMIVEGGAIRGGEVSSHNDHRIAMAAAVAGLTAETPVVIDGAEAVEKSYPAFWDDLETITTARG